MIGLFNKYCTVSHLGSYLALKFNKTTSLILHFKITVQIWINRYSHALCTWLRDWLSVSDGEGPVRRQHVALHRGLASKDGSGVHSGPNEQKAVNCMGFTAPKSLHPGPWTGCRVTHEGRVWHSPQALTEQQAAAGFDGLDNGAPGTWKQSWASFWGHVSLTVTSRCGDGGRHKCLKNT